MPKTVDIARIQAYVIPFEQLRMSDVNIVGGKNASLGELISQLSKVGVRVPSGFATTALAFRDFLKENNLTDRIEKRLRSLNTDDVKALAEAGKNIRKWITEAPLQLRLEEEIRKQFDVLQKNFTKESSFAVRSSATAEDLPDASFAGQQESYLNVVSISEVLDRVKYVFASLYNDRAISYRVHKGFAHREVALSVGIQRMVRSDISSSGVMFTIDTESGFRDAVFITSSYGLGEAIVQGAVNPDEFYVFKTTLAQDKYPIIRRSIGSKLIKMEFTQPEELGRVKIVDVALEQRNCYSITDDDVIELAKYAVIIEQHYKCPMDIEWGKDGRDGKLFILQARPETVKSQISGKIEHCFKLKGQSQVLTIGRAIGQKIGSGSVRVIRHPSEMELVQSGDVLVADMTDPNWEPIMKRAAAIVTNRGGRTCHAAIIARELGVPAVVGCGNATDILKDGMLVTVSCAEGDEGKIYDGLLEIEVTEVQGGMPPETKVKFMLNVSNPQLAFDFSQLPNSGVGLARLEFIINNNIGIHPKAILEYPNINKDIKKAIEIAARGHLSPYDFYIDKLSEGIATIAAAFYPKPVIVRMSDFKSNEYKKLIGGSLYEPNEENPMLGFRGTSRYISKDFLQAFEMECIALKRVRDKMSLSNVEIMIPFVRTVKQAKRVVDLLEKFGLKRGVNGLRLVMMCEVPTNAILAEEFLQFFDGFSIGSNDLTQLTLGLDRDSGIELLVSDFDERDPAVKFLIKRTIEICRRLRKYVGICGQGPSDHLDFAQWLANEGIVSISLNPDTIVDTWQALAKLNLSRR
ncbi:MAG: phosphoenolpyruvate synthase [Burkholderia sp.]|nr:phosphoenolpyruvate synthase [Burkholderia sp.]